MQARDLGCWWYLAAAKVCRSRNRSLSSGELYMGGAEALLRRALVAGLRTWVVVAFMLAMAWSLQELPGTRVETERADGERCDVSLCGGKDLGRSAGAA